jgi:hypothetical protein
MRIQDKGWLFVGCMGIALPLFELTVLHRSLIPSGDPLHSITFLFLIIYGFGRAFIGNPAPGTRGSKFLKLSVWAYGCLLILSLLLIWL